MDWENHLIKHLQWSDSIINREAKEHVAREIAATAKDGDVIGAGSGSTVYLTPVSYTHLDVYKRQEKRRSLPSSNGVA